MAATLDVATALRCGSLWASPPRPTHSGKLLRVVQTRTQANGASSVPFTLVCCSSDGACTVAVDGTGQVFLLDAHNNRCQLLQRFTPPPTALAFGHNGEVYVGTQDGALAILTPQPEDDGLWGVLEVKGHTGAVCSISVHPTAQSVLTVQRGERAVLWLQGPGGWAPARSLGKRGEGVLLGLFTPCGRHVVVCLQGAGLQVWAYPNFSSLTPLPRPRLPAGSILGPVAVAHNGSMLVAGAGTTTLYVYDLDSCTLLHALLLPPRAQAPVSLAFVHPSILACKDNPLLSVLCGDGEVRFISVHTPCTVCALGGSQLGLRAVALSAHSSRAACITVGGDLWLYDLRPLLLRAQVAGPMEEDVGGSVVDDLHIRDMQEAQGLGRDQLAGLLQTYGAFPARYRAVIWQMLLQVPGNTQAHSALLDRGTHTAYSDLDRRYPIRDRQRVDRLKSLLSSLAHWHPGLALCSWLPRLVYPFTGLLARNDLALYECVATVLGNWCRDWLVAGQAPTGPVRRMQQLVQAHDHVLTAHMEACCVGPEVYAWPLLGCGMADVLRAEDWLALWDHVLCRAPSYLEACVVAYVLLLRAKLLQCAGTQDVKALYLSEPSVDLRQLLAMADQMIGADSQQLVPLNRGPTYVVPFETDLAEQLSRAQQRARAGRGHTEETTPNEQAT